MTHRPSDELLFDALRVWAIRSRGMMLHRIRATFIDGSVIAMTLPGSEATGDETMNATTARITSPMCCADILDVLRQVGHRLVTDEVIAELDRHGRKWGESTIKNTLAEMVAIGLLDNKANVRPRGYGLPDT